MPDGSLFHIITAGEEKMPSYAEQIRPRDRWLIVNYVRVLHRALDPKPEDLEP
jgi:mono/diheme cytochrome c family protein